jgi:hypothetical protein
MVRTSAAANGRPLAFRRTSSAAVVRFDDIMDALKELDGEAARSPPYGKFISRARRWKDLYRAERRGPLSA